MVTIHLMKSIRGLTFQKFQMRKANFQKRKSIKIQMVKSFGKLTTFQMEKMTIAGITGALTTGARSGICATNPQQKLMKVMQSLDLIQHGGQQVASMKRSRKISQMLEFRGFMMSRAWK